MKGGRMWEWVWWRRLEREYREKRQREDDQKREERRERARRRTPHEAELEARKYDSWTTEQLLAEAERLWGVDFHLEEYGMARPKEIGLKVVVEIGGERCAAKEFPVGVLRLGSAERSLAQDDTTRTAGRGRPGYKRDVLAELLVIVLTGKRK
ncbi:MAG: hypothetical protein LAN37_07405 [Acidobacteriia bacterium]|nr:hypothetical protein [Terriglobia bacterium]